MMRHVAAIALVLLSATAARADEDSDLDVLVVEPSVTDQWDEMVRLRDALNPLGVPADVLVVSQRTFDYWADTPNTVLYEAVREGRVFHATQRTR